MTRIPAYADQAKLFEAPGQSRSNKVIEHDGIVHYAVLVSLVQSFLAITPTPPFLVKLCELCDAYEKASGWYEFRYPAWTCPVEEERDGYPTCAACCCA